MQQFTLLADSWSPLHTSTKKPTVHPPGFAAHVGVFMIMLTALQVQAGHTPAEGAEVSLFLVLSLLPLLVAALMFVWVFCEVGTDELKQQRAEKAHEKFVKRRAEREAARAELRAEEAERTAAARAQATTAI